MQSAFAPREEEAASWSSHRTSVAPVATPDRDEQALLAGLRRGDDAAYAELLARHGGRMLATARRLLRNEDEAREALQDACLAAFRSVAFFREGAKLSTWLHRIVVNAALMRLRAASRRPEVSLEPLLPLFDENGRHASPVPEWAPPPETALLDGELRARVREAIAALPAAYRAVVVLRDLEQLDTGEAARVLGISANAVKVRLHRARQALTTLLAPRVRRER